LHVFALECSDPKFKLVKKAISEYAKMSNKFHHYEEKHK